MSTNNLNSAESNLLRMAQQPEQSEDELSEKEIGDLTPEQMNLLQSAQEIPELEREVGKFRSILNAFPKGFLTIGGHALGGGLTQPNTMPLEEALETILPTQKDGSIEGGLERAGGIFAGGGGGGLLAMILKSITGGALGETVSRLPWIPEKYKPYAEVAAELGPQFFPKLGKNIIPKKSQVQIVEDARRLGLSEKEITPLIQGENKQKFLSKLAKRRGNTSTALQKSKQGLDNVYDILQNTDIAQKELLPHQVNDLFKNIQDKLFELPSGIQDLISKDFQQLLQKPMTGKTLINFYKDINSVYGKSGGRALGILKDPIKKALAKIDPSLANDFNMTNNLFSKYYNISKRLKPNLVHDFISAGEATAVVAGVVTGNYPLIAKVAGEHAARKISAEMLTNPRFQNLSRQMILALNSGKIALANRLLRSFSKEIKDISPEISQKFQSIDLEDINISNEE